MAGFVLHKEWDCGHALGAGQLTNEDKERIVREINA